MSVAANAEVASVPPLRGPIARHPWCWFFLIALLPTVAVSFGGSLFFVTVTDWFAPLAAMLVARATDERGQASPRRSLRLTVFAIALAVSLGYYWWASLPYGLSYLALYCPSCVTLAAALACAYSPRVALRELPRPLLRLRSPWFVYALALLALPLLDGLAMLVWHTAAAKDAQALGLGPLDVLRLVPHSFITTLLAAIAWYGFAARRLLHRLSPLVTALIVGLLPCLALVLPITAWSIVVGSAPVGLYVPRALLSALAITLIGIWVYQRSQGSLLPVALLLLESGITPLHAWAVLGFDADGLVYVMLTLHCLLALVLVGQGRMWQSPGPQQTEPGPFKQVSSGHDAKPLDA